METHTTTIRDLKVSYRTAGDPKAPTVVFLHAWGVRLGKNRQMLGLGFDNVILELSKGYYVLAPEHPGLIRSETPKEFWAYEDYAQILRALIIQLKISKPTLIGSSFGGGIATTYASLFSDEVEALALIHSVLPKKLSDNTKNVFNPYIWLSNKKIPYFLKKSIVSIMCGAPLSYIDRENLSRRIQFIKNEQDCALDADYSKIKPPVLLVYASNDHKIHPVEIAKEWNKDWPSSKLVLAKDSSGPGFLYKHPSRYINVIKREIKKTS